MFDIEKGSWKKDLYWFSHYNYLEEIRKNWDLPSKIEIHDATLRDGEQTPGVVLKPDEKVAIAEKLAEVGIHRIEAGMPAVSADDFNAIKRICKLGLPSKILGFARANTEDIKKVAEAGAWGVVIEVPIGYPKLRYQFDKDWKWVLENSAKSIEMAKELGLHVVYFPYDATRSIQEEYVGLLSELAKISKPDSIGVVDTVGCAIPEAISYMVKLVKKVTGCPVEIHTHNDLAIGAATSLAAVSAGAEVVHVAVNGLGERTGNTGLEEMLVALKCCYGYSLDEIKFSQLRELSVLVERLTGVPINLNKPIVGERAYTRESGIGVDQVLNFPMSMFNMDPRFVGCQGKVVYGKKSGLLSVKIKLEQMGKTAETEQQQRILELIKAKGIENKRILTDEEVEEIVNKVLA